MASGADTGDPHRRLIGIGLEPGDQPLQIVRRQAFLCDDQERLAADFDHRFQIPEQIERQSIEAAGQHMRRGGSDAQCMAVSGRADRAADTQAAGSARDILNDDGLPQNGPHLLTKEPRHRVGGATCRKWHDHGNRPGRIALRLANIARSQTDKRRNQ